VRCAKIRGVPAWRRMSAVAARERQAIVAGTEAGEPMFEMKHVMGRNPISRKGAVVLAVAGVALAGLLAVTAGAGADDKNPFAGDAKIAKLGEYQFRINCAFCHGLNARGGGRGPDLTKAQKKHGNSDGDLFRTISQGVPGTAMPAGVNGGIGVGMTEEEIWQVITYIRSVQVKAPTVPIGDARHGKELFYGSARCGTCHMVEGKGGRLGPDLTTAGSMRSVESLVDSVRNPSRRLAQGLKEAAKEFPQEYETVMATTADGKKITGVTLNEDSFSLQMMDADEKIYFLEKDKLKSFEKSRESLMPPYDPKMLSEKDLNDLVAFLLNVGAK
jgi:cytochrome c oxidase cbb3-type subunit III